MACQSVRVGRRADIAAAFAPGDHATTFGGQPLAARAALAVLDVMERERVPERAARAGTRLVESLAKVDGIAEVRGAGLLIAAELAPPRDAREVAQKCLDLGLVVNAVTPTALRFAPPLLVSDAEIDDAVAPGSGGVAVTKNLLEIDDLDPARLATILDDSVAWKADPTLIPPVLSGRSVVALFQKPSARTRISIETAIATLSRSSRSTCATRRSTSTCGNRSRTSPARWRRCAR